MLKKSLIAISLLTVLAGCQSTPPEPKSEIDELACYFPDSPKDKAPKWVCGITPSSLEISGTGYSKNNIAGLSLMNDIALLDARKQLGLQFKTKVQSSIKQATTSNTTITVAEGSAATNDNSPAGKTAVGAEQQQINQAVTDHIESVAKSIASTELTNSRLIVNKRSPAGGLYVLVGMDKATYDMNVDKIIKEASNKNSNLWGKFNDKKTSEQLEKVLSGLNAK